MTGRNLWLIAILVAAVVVPYHLSGDAQWSSINNWWRSMWSTAEGNGYEEVTYDSYRQPWPGTAGPPPTASTSPLPPNYARRPIENTRTPVAPYGASPALPQANDLSNAPIIPGASTPNVVPNQVRHPQYHDWMPVNPAQPTAQTPGNAEAGETPPGAPEPRLCGPVAPTISQLLSFDVTPAWVMNNWQRVSTRLAEFELEGLRVPIVTGTEVDDLVGTMTYSFDHRQTLQRISFDGFTGDPAPLVHVMTNQYGMQAEPWLGAGLYVDRDQANELASILRIVHAPVIRSSQARRRYTVEFELNREASKHGLSQQFTSLIEADRNSQALEATAENENPSKSPEELENEALIKKREAETGQVGEQPTVKTGDTVLASDPIGSSKPKPLVQPKPPVQPKPLNGSAETKTGFLGRFGSGQSGSPLYPSQLPSNWQSNVPP